MYDYQRNHLSKEVNRLSQFVSWGRDRIKNEAEQLFAGNGDQYWKKYALIYCREDGQEIWRLPLDTTVNVPVDLRMLKEASSSGKDRLIVSNRTENLYTAIQKIATPRNQISFLVLQAGIDPVVLEQSDYLLEITQIYQSLDLRRSDLMRSFFLAFILIGALLVSIAVITGIWISSRITSPVSQVVAATAELGKGNLDYRLPVAKGGDEVSQLMHHFNQMAQRLKENQEQMIYLEKRAAWQQMARKIAHEIKNPLTPIQLTIQQLVDKYSGPDQDYQKLLTECAQIINEEIGSLRQLVTEFSEFGRLPELQLQIGNFNEILKEIATLYSQRVQLNLQENLPATDLDYDRIRRVLINLVENAIQADPDGHPVMVESKGTNSQIILTVQDRGEGISPENLKRIFEPYYSTKKTGTGLGLAISRLIIEEHGGKISVQSAPGEGSTFILEFPVKGKEVNEE
jgi:nitrogen fixation/metabolism regulation signal transduction histidine kinase